MSGWNAPVCGACWNADNHDRPMDPARDGFGPAERCCSCGMVTFSGIYVRKNPDEQTYNEEARNALPMPFEEAARDDS